MKLKTIKTLKTFETFKPVTISLSSLSCLFLAFAVIFTLSAIKTYAAVGWTYKETVSEYGQPQTVPLNKAISRKNLQKYQANGITVSSYKFQINNFKIIALFNADNICYEMKTFNNRTLPSLKDLVGSALAATQPVVLKRVWLRSTTLQYGSGSNAVIYRSFGPPGDLSVKVYSPALKPFVP